MASIICCSAPFMIRASSGSMKNPDSNRKKSVSWWAPLFGIPSDPDYLNIESSTLEPNPVQIDVSESGQDSGQKLRRRGCLTEEKARELRKKIAQGSTFHEVMYHSAIASRLASDISGRVKD
ncbi:unnamed protein product [Eruca vesicaria subsp. sativa]|uniref:Uncharacterized protein n=1 Tax=Eruca vesicaria subsp. sativa TaxID=29727 RepID=A0ABC8M301_ERUVS|nr:unnamed protein product [Eruca vesicaria subsp. sativa]